MEVNHSMKLIMGPHLDWAGSVGVLILCQIERCGFGCAWSLLSSPPSLLMHFLAAKNENPSSFNAFYTKDLSVFSSGIPFRF